MLADLAERLGQVTTTVAFDQADVARVLDTMAKLPHHATAGEFVKDIEINREWGSDRLRVVAFLQNDRTRQVFGAATTDIQ